MILQVGPASRAAFDEAVSRLPFLELELSGTPWLESEQALELARDCFAWFYGPVEPSMDKDVPMAGIAAAALLAQPLLTLQRRSTKHDLMLSVAALRELWKALNSLFPLLGKMNGSDGDSTGNGEGDGNQGNMDDAIADAGAEVAKRIQDMASVKKETEVIVPATGWDLSHGRMVRLELEDILTLAALVERKDWFYALVETLGRIEDMGNVWNPAPSVGAKGEIHSVGRGGSIEDMLPAEAMLLLQEVTKPLFFSKLYERSLLAYQMKTDTSEGGSDPGGPIIALVDTSASMRGGAEVVAKAMVLAAARVARHQNRRFLVGIFGSKNEYHEFEMVGKVSRPGKFLEFLSQSFQGGTDFDGPINRVCARIVEAGWQAADCLVLTDGMGLPSAHTKAVVNAVRREYGTFFMGIIIGRAKARGLDGIMDHSVFTDGQDIQGLGQALRMLKQRQ